MAGENKDLATRGRKKKGGMKRLKGFITGKSRRERKAKQQSMTSQNNEPDDSSTLYGADLDASVAGDGRSVSSMSYSQAAKQPVFADPIQVILLIMDPATRRFELLQLEFDSALSKVSDIFKQIPEAATEEVLQKTTYKAIITPKGEELNSDSSLSEIATGATVVIAVPESSDESLEKCAAMAVPILTNSKVHKMLLSVGIKPDDLPEKPKKVKKVVEKVEEPKKEEEVVATPQLIEEPKEELKPIEEVPAVPNPNPVPETPAPVVKEEEEDDTNYFFIGVLFAIFAHLFFKAHLSISAPLAPGSTLAMGKYRSSCGLLGSVPYYPCEPKSVNMGTDGILEVFEGEELIFSLEGKVCAIDSEGCVDGVVIEEDGTLKIGGEEAKAKMKTTSTLSPWPFSEDVVYKTGLRNII